MSGDTESEKRLGEGEKILILYMSNKKSAWKWITSTKSSKQKLTDQKILINDIYSARCCAFLMLKQRTEWLSSILILII